MMMVMGIKLNDYNTAMVVAIVQTIVILIVMINMVLGMIVIMTINGERRCTYDVNGNGDNTNLVMITILVKA